MTAQMTLDFARAAGDRAMRAAASNAARREPRFSERAGAYHDDSQIDRHVIERVIRQGEESCAVTLREIAA